MLQIFQWREFGPVQKFGRAIRQSKDPHLEPRPKMKLQYFCQWLLMGAAAVQAGSIRKRVKSSIEIAEPRGLERFSSLFDQDFLAERELEDEMIMSMSMADTSPPTPSPTPSSTLAERDALILEKCEQTALERSRDILSILSFISEPDSLLIVGTPQFQARAWIGNTDSAIICAEESDRIAQRYRAAVIYFALGGDNWSTSTMWLEVSNECEWFGLECEGYTQGDSDSYVPITSVVLDENNLVGELPSEIYGLAEVERLLMEKNQISGTISVDISNLGKLTELDLDTNELVGTLPLSLYDMPQLNKIDLNSNRLEGTLSNAVGSLSNLQVLQLEDNNFTGDVPADGLLQLESLGMFNEYHAWLMSPVIAINLTFCT
jgi:hypothetical protein